MTVECLCCIVIGWNSWIYSKLDKWIEIKLSSGFITFSIQLNNIPLPLKQSLKVLARGPFLPQVCVWWFWKVKARLVWGLNFGNMVLISGYIKGSCHCPKVAVTSMTYRLVCTFYCNLKLVWNLRFSLFWSNRLGRHFSICMTWQSHNG